MVKGAIQTWGLTIKVMGMAGKPGGLLREFQQWSKATDVENFTAWQ